MNKKIIISIIVLIIIIAFIIISVISYPKIVANNISNFGLDIFRKS